MRVIRSKPNRLNRIASMLSWRTRVIRWKPNGRIGSPQCRAGGRASFARSPIGRMNRLKQLADARHSLEAQSAESVRLSTELSEARHRLTELDRALEAQARQLELKRRQGDARRKRTEDLEAALESRSAEVTSLSAQVTDATMQLQLLTASTSWRLTRPLRRFAEQFPWSVRQLKRVLKLFWEALTFQLGSRVRHRIRRNRKR